MKLVYKDTQIEVKGGDVVTDFRGDSATVDFPCTGAEPQSEGSTGRVYVDEGRGYYPSVYGMVWVQQ